MSALTRRAFLRLTATGAVVWPLADARGRTLQTAGEALTVMSFNIRYDNPADGPDAWPLRKDWVAEIVREHADVAGLQEVRKGQLDDLKERLPGFEFYGVGRDDGKEAGEFVPVGWRKDRFTATDKGVFWLSETPDEVGRVVVAGIGLATRLPVDPEDDGTDAHRAVHPDRLLDRHAADLAFEVRPHLLHVADRLGRGEMGVHVDGLEPVGHARSSAA